MDPVFQFLDLEKGIHSKSDRPCAQASLALIALDDRKVKLDVQACKKRGTLRPLPLNCALTFIHVSKLFSFWNWKEIE